MKLDRAAFFLLTSSLAGLAVAACNATEPPPQPAPVSTGAGSAAPLASSSASSAPPAVVDASAPAVDASVAVADASAPPVDPHALDASVAQSSGPSISIPPLPPEQRKPLGGDSGCGKSRKTFDPKKPSCDDTEGSLEDCVGLSGGWYPSNEVCPGGSLVRKRCSAHNADFKPHIAAIANACLKQAQGASCNGCKIFGCSHEALMTACPDPTADADCDVISGRCNDVDKNRCRSYLSGMTAKGRAAMVECLTKQCSKGFLACVVGLSQ
jgi:hypothetical protein